MSISETFSRRPNRFTLTLTSAFTAIALTAAAGTSCAQAPDVSAPASLGAQAPGTLLTPAMQIPAIPAVISPVVPPSNPGPSIDWQIHNRFRLFNESVLSKENNLLQALTGDSTAYEAYESYSKFLASHVGAIDNLYENTTYDRNSGTYAPGYLLPTYQEVDASIEHLPPNPGQCDWYIELNISAHSDCSKPTRLRLPLSPKDFSFEGSISVRPAGGGPGTEISKTTVKTRDIMIVGLGDSYAAGEGNPDLPADPSIFAPRPQWLDARPYVWWTPSIIPPARVFAPQSAQWWSNECHRSLFSGQVVAALKIAAKRPHDSVTFISHACSGAAVLDGLVSPQHAPPGEQRFGPAPGASWRRISARQHSQLETLMHELCSSTHYEPYTPQWDAYSFWKEQRNVDRSTNATTRIPTCDAPTRKPTLILLSIGGNDVGFAGLATWALTNNIVVKNPQFRYLLAGFSELVGGALSWNNLGVVCPNTSPGNADIRCDTRQKLLTLPNTRSLLDNDLDPLIGISKQAIRQMWDPERTVILQTAYPDPLNDELQGPCGKTPTVVFHGAPDLAVPWEAAERMIPEPRDNTVLSFTDSAAGQVADVAFNGGDSLNGKIVNTAEATWKVAPEPTGFKKHGLCAASHLQTLSIEFGFPQLETTSARRTWSDEWMTPQGWHPYERRARWFRTANDSFLTQAVATSRGSFTAESFTGIGHPTAEGQAAIADQISDALPPTLKSPEN